MAVYSTNWNLYRTHFRTTTKNSSKGGYGRNGLTKKEENELLEALVEQLHDL